MKMRTAEGDGYSRFQEPVRLSRVVKSAPAAPLDTPSAPLRALGNTAISAVNQLDANLPTASTLTRAFQDE